MKKCILLAAFAMMATAISAFAQESVFNTADFTYSPVTMKVKGDGASVSTKFNAVSVNYDQARLLPISFPLYIQYGAGLQYTWKTEKLDGVKDSDTFLTLKVPVSVLYQFEVPNFPLTIMPYAGLNLQAHLLGQSKTSDEGESLKFSYFDKDDMGGDPYNRFVVGWQLGARFMYQDYFIGLSYNGPVTNLYKYSSDVKIRYSQFNISLGLRF